MKKIIFLFLSFTLLSCVSVKRYNEKLDTPIAPEKLRDDVDYAYGNLKKLHPNLYWYISKEDLDYKFDSIKKEIQHPLTPFQFYEKLAPIIADIKEGHLRLVAPDKKLEKKELKKLEFQKGLLSRMNYVIDEDRIFVKDNAEKFENIKVGTEILKIKDIPVKDYLDRYSKFVNSDGENATYQKYSMARRWPVFFTIENGILDSLKIQTKLGNEIKDLYIHRETISKEEKKEKETESKKISKTEKGKTQDYNIVTKSYNRDLQFPLKDSSIAYIKIKTFSGTYSRKFYKESFATIKKANAEYLILDMRDNLGGSLYEINNLYSYLALDEFQFIKDIEVTKRNAMYHANYFSEFSPLMKPIAVIGYPFYLIGTAFSMKKDDGKVLLKNNNKIFSIRKPKKNAFRGTIYVLINGSSFSAASILPSKLKGHQRAILVGEETGGTNDGTVAGRYSTKKLPNSKLLLPIGLMLIQPNIEFNNSKKGVIPDIEIVPSLIQVLQKKDIQVDWVMQEIAKSSHKL